VSPEDGDRKLDIHELEQRTQAVLQELANLVETVNVIIRETNPVEIHGQLRAVADSVRKLAKQGIPIPDELRGLKIALAAKEATIEETERIQARIIRSLNEALARLGAVAHTVPVKPGTKSAVRGAKKKDGDDKIVDLFSWKAQ